jgi:hypothetical protein
LSVHQRRTDEPVSQHSGGDEVILTGSPFAPGSITDAANSDAANSDAANSSAANSSAAAHDAAVQATVTEVLTDGVMKYTAKGSATASLMVVFFASTAAWWFPAGGVLIAALGCGLAVGGLFSDYRLLAAGLLVVHLGLFFACYVMTIG